MRKFNRFRVFGPGAVVLFVASGLSGCGGTCPEDCQTELAVGSDYAAVSNPALAATARDFVGDRGRAPRGGFLLIDPDVLKPGGDTPHRLVRDRGLSLAHERTAPLAGQTRLYARATAAVGQSVHALPEGMGVLTDPARIGLTSLTLQPEIGLRRDWQLGRTRLGGALGLGVQTSLTETTITSALLDVRHRSVETMPYASLRLNAGPDHGRLSASVELRVAQDGMTQLRGDLRVPLGAQRRRPAAETRSNCSAQC